MCQHLAINFSKDPNRNITLKSIRMFPTKEVVKHLFDSQAVNYNKKTVVLSRWYQSLRSWQKIIAKSASRGDLTNVDGTNCYFTPSSKSWVGLIDSIDKCVLTPWSRSRERVRRIIATINLEELSNNLYGICAGCHPLMLSTHLGVSRPSAMGKLFYCYVLTPQVYICAGN